jgi:hypothetical protein
VGATGSRSNGKGAAQPYELQVFHAANMDGKNMKSKEPKKSAIFLYDF